MTQRPVDQWDGRPLLRFWHWDCNAARKGLKVLARRPRKHDTSGHKLWPEYKEDVWCGGYVGYGRDEFNQPLFRSLQNALRFAQAAHCAGYRVIGKKRAAK